MRRGLALLLLVVTISWSTPVLAVFAPGRSVPQDNLSHSIQRALSNAISVDVVETKGQLERGISNGSFDIVIAPPGLLHGKNLATVDSIGILAEQEMVLLCKEKNCGYTSGKKVASLTLLSSKAVVPYLSRSFINVAFTETTSSGGPTIVGFYTVEELGRFLLFLEDITFVLLPADLVPDFKRVTSGRWRELMAVRSQRDMPTLAVYAKPAWATEARRVLESPQILHELEPSGLVTHKVGR